MASQQLQGMLQAFIAIPILVPWNDVFGLAASFHGPPDGSRPFI